VECGAVRRRWDLNRILTTRAADRSGPSMRWMIGMAFERHQCVGCSAERVAFTTNVTFDERYDVGAAATLGGRPPF